MKYAILIFGFIFSSHLIYAQIEVVRTIPAYQNDGKALINTLRKNVNIRWVSGPTQFNDMLNQTRRRVYISNLTPGNYTVDVEETESLCVTQLDFEILNCQDIDVVNLENGITEPSDCESNDGVFYIGGSGVNASYITGGVHPYEVILIFDDEGQTIEPDYSNHWGGLKAGNYSLNIIDGNGCETAITFLIQANEGMRPLVIIETSPSCIGQTNGVIEADAIGPDGEECTLNWSNGTSYIEHCYIENLAPGTYTVTVTYAGGTCPTTESALVETINAQGPLTIQSNQYDACDENTGIIEVTASGGVAPYRYSWSSGSTSKTLRQVAPSEDYCLTVTDYCGNTISDCFSVEVENQANALTVVSEVLPDCPGDAVNNGEIQLITSGGKPYYRYKWGDNPSRGSMIENLTSGNYTYTVTDDRGCNVVGNVEVPEIGIRVLLDDFKHCENGNCDDAFINITIEIDDNIAGEFTNVRWHSWLNGNGYYQSNQEDISDLTEPGEYILTIDNGRGCEYKYAIEIKDCGDNIKKPKIKDETIIPAGPANNELGSIFFNLEEKDNDIFTFSWTGPDNFTSNDFRLYEANGPGEYTLEINYGCDEKVTKKFTIGQCALAVSLENLDAGCGYANLASVSIRVMGNVDNKEIIPLLLEETDGYIELSGSNRIGNDEIFYFTVGDGSYNMGFFLEPDYCNGAISFEVNSSLVGWGTVLPRNRLFYAQRGGGNFTPLLCLTDYYCDTYENYRKTTNNGSPSITYNSQSCDFSILCRGINYPVNSRIIEGDFYDPFKNECASGTFCEAYEVFDPVGAEVLGIGSDYVPILMRRSSSIPPTYYGAPDGETIITNENEAYRCTTTYYCNGQVVDEIESNAYSKTVCGTLHGYSDEYCVVEYYCPNESQYLALESYKTDDFVYPHSNCCTVGGGWENEKNSMDDALYEKLKLRKIKENLTNFKSKTEGLKTKKKSSANIFYNVFPNPSSTYFSIDRNIGGEELTVHLINTSGIILEQKTWNRTSLKLEFYRQYPSGIYLMKLVNTYGQIVYIQKISIINTQ